MIGYRLYNRDDSIIVESSEIDLYQYRLYIGSHKIQTEKQSSYWFIDQDRVSVLSGNNSVLESQKLCVQIFGYTPEFRSSTYSRYTDLPYINGCSSKQLISPARPGDPTWQLLLIPADASEQAHHIHSTTRVVYVHEGQGVSHIGAGKNQILLDLTPGSILVLDKMIPHHFSTTDSHLVVFPLHIYSSVAQEFNHPMFNGTHRV